MLHFLKSGRMWLLAAMLGMAAGCSASLTKNDLVDLPVYMPLQDDFRTGNVIQVGAVSGAEESLGITLLRKHLEMYKYNVFKNYPGLSGAQRTRVRWIIEPQAEAIRSLEIDTGMVSDLLVIFAVRRPAQIVDGKIVAQDSTYYPVWVRTFGAPYADGTPVVTYNMYQTAVQNLFCIREFRKQLME